MTLGAKGLPVIMIERLSTITDMAYQQNGRAQAGRLTSSLKQSGMSSGGRRIRGVRDFTCIEDMRPTAIKEIKINVDAVRPHFDWRLLVPDMTD